MTLSRPARTPAPQATSPHQSARCPQNLKDGTQAQQASHVATRATPSTIVAYDSVRNVPRWYQRAVRR